VQAHRLHAEAADERVTDADTRPRVLIAHGWGGWAGQMRRIAEAGFRTTLLSYPTAFASFDRGVDLARRVVDASDTAPLHFVGYSLGGLVLRALAAESPPGLESLLLIGVPNAGSPLADIVTRIVPTPMLRRLRTSEPSLPNLGNIRIGCIAGSRKGPLGLILDGDNDGRVPVTSALGIGYHDARVIREGHRALMSSRETARLAVSFLTMGSFAAQPVGTAIIRPDTASLHRP